MSGGRIRPRGDSDASSEVLHHAEIWCHTQSMPHAKRHHTDTGELSEPLDQAQRRRPDAHDRKELLLRLAAAEREASERGEAVRETSGALTGVYRPDELERLREDWPT